MTVTDFYAFCKAFGIDSAEIMTITSLVDDNNLSVWRDI